MPSQIVSSTDHGSLVVSSNLISRPPWKRFLKKSEFPHVKNLKNHSPWVPRDYTKRTPVGTHGPIRRPRIPLFKGGESLTRLRLGKRLVKLLPVAQRTNAFTTAVQVPWYIILLIYTIYIPKYLVPGTVYSTRHGVHFFFWPCRLTPTTRSQP